MLKLDTEMQATGSACDALSARAPRIPIAELTAASARVDTHIDDDSQPALAIASTTANKNANANAKMEERSLCEDALRGDVAAWNALVQRHNHRVVVSLLARGVRIDRAKDIAQDAWIRLIEQQREGRLTHLQLPGLAVAQAGFLALEAMRRAKRTDPVEASAEDVVDPAADAEMRLLTEERLARAERILSKCSPSARNVFRLAYGGEGLDHAQIAARLGLSLQRVRQIVCEVRKQLRGAVEGVGHERA